MKCTSTVIVTKVELKTKKDSNDNYLLISFLDMLTGDVFEVLEKNIEVMRTVNPMSKRENFEVNFKNTKYGIKCEILSYGTEIKL